MNDFATELPTSSGFALQHLESHRLLGLRRLLDLRHFFAFGHYFALGITLLLVITPLWGITSPWAIILRLGSFSTIVPYHSPQQPSAIPDLLANMIAARERPGVYWSQTGAWMLALRLGLRTGSPVVWPPPAPSGISPLPSLPSRLFPDREHLALAEFRISGTIACLCCHQRTPLFSALIFAIPSSRRSISPMPTSLATMDGFDLPLARVL
ncbi:hypothetical protein BT96DRAFT_1010012 [Gymnopus androsaceus JB14]|uniref:Uncharacterized protein n=1 Tax=Gymnopus androsaceus JB14 TaxID=1447944 RepID=A0A6A4GBN7_9AGAR|nr:hypothetical protein BT96DRAFT_1010012 [Gymnopus androsaceus JB14]